MTEPISLAEAKSHLRVLYDNEDAYIGTLITAAREFAENYQNRVYVDRQDDEGNAVVAETMPAMEKAACLLLIGHWFENREAVNIGKNASEVPLGATMIFNLRRNLPI
ncbi:MAG: phage gp6-like head-tail connector protein [Synergistes sp.]|nr:phage gp6-like head-tail connector protein [Synergistes sp.]